MELISPKYRVALIRNIESAIWAEYSSYADVSLYIEGWHQDAGDWTEENFKIKYSFQTKIDLLATLSNI